MLINDKMISILLEKDVYEDECKYLQFKEIISKCNEKSWFIARDLHYSLEFFEEAVKFIEKKDGSAPIYCAPLWNMNMALVERSVVKTSEFIHSVICDTVLKSLHNFNDVVGPHKWQDLIDVDYKITVAGDLFNESLEDFTAKMKLEDAKRSHKSINDKRKKLGFDGNKFNNENRDKLIEELKNKAETIKNMRHAFSHPYGHPSYPGMCPMLRNRNVVEIRDAIQKAFDLLNDEVGHLLDSLSLINIKDRSSFGRDTNLRDWHASKALNSTFNIIFRPDPIFKK